MGESGPCHCQSLSRDDGRFALKITKAGREAIGVEHDDEQHPSPASEIDDLRLLRTSANLSG
jgi:hypothetical protein